MVARFQANIADTSSIGSPPRSRRVCHWLHRNRGEWILPGRAARDIDCAMDKAIKLGRFIFAAGIALLGIQQILVGDFVQGVFIAPAWLPGRAFCAYLSGVALFAAASGFAVTKQVRLPAQSLAAVLALELLVFQLPSPLAILHDGVARTRAFETLAFAAAAAVLAGAPAAVVILGRLLFAFAMVVFGVQHFMYAGFVASVVPSWIPGPLAWTYLTGVAMIAAGLSLAVGTMARLSGFLLGIMFLLWVALLHAPRVAAHLGDEKEWNSAAVALAMGGAAWILAEGRQRREGASPIGSSPSRR